MPACLGERREADGSEVILIIGNSGDAPARHTRFQVEDGIPWSDSPWYAPAQLPALRDGIPYLAPGRTLRFPLGLLDWDRATKQSGWLNVKISFEGEEGRKFIHPANIDLRRYAGLSFDTFIRTDRQVVEALLGMLRLGTDFVDRNSPSRTTHQWCPACARAVPYSAKKCAECGEWLPGAGTTSSALQYSSVCRIGNRM